MNEVKSEAKSLLVEFYKDVRSVVGLMVKSFYEKYKNKYMTSKERINMFSHKFKPLSSENMIDDLISLNNGKLSKTGGGDLNEIKCSHGKLYWDNTDKVYKTEDLKNQFSLLNYNGYFIEALYSFGGPAINSRLYRLGDNFMSNDHKHWLQLPMEKAECQHRLEKFNPRNQLTIHVIKYLKKEVMNLKKYHIFIVFEDLEEQVIIDRMNQIMIRLDQSISACGEISKTSLEIFKELIGFNVLFQDRNIMFADFNISNEQTDMIIKFINSPETLADNYKPSEFRIFNADSIWIDYHLM